MRNREEAARQTKEYFNKMILDLYSPDQARTLINKPIQTIFFDECIPTRNQIKEGKGWKLDEAVGC